MDYEYKSVLLNHNLSKQLAHSHNETLNEQFKSGWEYVDSICQAFGTGDSSRSKGCGSVIVILKKKL